MNRSIILLLLLLSGVLSAQSTWLVDSSVVRFEILNAGIAVDGTFKGLDASIEFAPEDLSVSQMSASVDAATVESGIRIRDNHLRKSDYFDTDSFPTIHLHSIGFQREGNGQFSGNWILEIKGIAKAIAFPFTFENDSGKAAFTGTFTINRRDFNIGGRSPILDDAVRVDIQVWAHSDGMD